MIIGLLLVAAALVFGLQCGVAIRDIVAMYKEHWRAALGNIEIIRRRNRLVIGFEWVLIWLFLLVWALSGEERYFYLALISSVCFGVAILVQLAIKYLYHLHPKG